MADDTKPQFTTTGFEAFDTHVEALNQRPRQPRALDAARLGLTVLAALAGIVIVGTAADTFAVFDNTSLGPEFFLFLWPTNFDTRPTVALIICGALIILANIASLVVSKVPSLQDKTALCNAVSFSAPLVALIAAVIGTSFSYHINASSTDFTLQGWSCQWSNINMSVDPHFDTLCRESKTALYLTVMVIPTEVLIMGAVLVDFVVAKRQTPYAQERKGSPAFS